MCVFVTSLYGGFQKYGYLPSWLISWKIPTKNGWLLGVPWQNGKLHDFFLLWHRWNPGEIPREIDSANPMIFYFLVKFIKRHRMIFMWFICGSYMVHIWLIYGYGDISIVSLWYFCYKKRTWSHGPVEIVDLPSYDMVDLSSSLCLYVDQADFFPFKNPDALL